MAAWRDDQRDDYQGARGVFNGVGISILIWAVIIALIYTGWHV